MKYIYENRLLAYDVFLVWLELASWVESFSFHEEIGTHYFLEFYDGALRGTSCHGVEIVGGGDGCYQWRRWK